MTRQEIQNEIAQLLEIARASLTEAQANGQAGEFDSPIAFLTDEQYRRLSELRQARHGAR